MKQSNPFNRTFIHSMPSKGAIPGLRSQNPFIRAVSGVFWLMLLLASVLLGLVVFTVVALVTLTVAGLRLIWHTITGPSKRPLKTESGAFHRETQPQRMDVIEAEYEVVDRNRDSGRRQE